MCALRASKYHLSTHIDDQFHGNYPIFLLFIVHLSTFASRDCHLQWLRSLSFSHSLYLFNFIWQTFVYKCLFKLFIPSAICWGTDFSVTGRNCARISSLKNMWKKFIYNSIGFEADTTQILFILYQMKPNINICVRREFLHGECENERQQRKEKQKCMKINGQIKYMEHQRRTSCAKSWHGNFILFLFSSFVSHIFGEGEKNRCQQEG